MPDSQRIAGVRFRNAGKISYYDAGGMRLEAGEHVIVETTRGPELARVVIAPGQVLVNEIDDENLKPILRLATAADVARMDELQERATEILPEARRIAEDAGFRGHIESASYTLDGRRLTFAFSSEERQDYREFVRSAARQFGVKTDMHQVGARDRARLAGGYGICGRELCCSSWLTTFPSISIRMAKEQDLPLNPQKISGLCGRLLCCLSYEEEGYKQMRKTLPKVGQRCSTPTGEGKAIAVNILRRQVTLLIDGQRVDIQDRDLGTVVRWDTTSKTGDPPPSITREEALAQGLVDRDELDGAEDAFGTVFPQRRAPEAVRGRLPAPAPRREVRDRTGRQPEGDQQGRSGRSQPLEPARRERPGTDPGRGRPNPQPDRELPAGRVFRRGERPGGPGSREPDKTTPPGEDGATRRSGRRRRRRGQQQPRE